MISHQFHLLIPGHVIGMLLLWAYLSIRGNHPIPESLNRAVSPLLAYLALFFVPINVGILDHLSIFQTEGSVIAWAMGVGLIVPLLFTAITLEWWFRRTEATNSTAPLQHSKQQS